MRHHGVNWVLLGRNLPICATAGAVYVFSFHSSVMYNQCASCNSIIITESYQFKFQLQYIVHDTASTFMIIFHTNLLHHCIRFEYMTINYHFVFVFHLRFMFVLLVISGSLTDSW